MSQWFKIMVHAVIAVIIVHGNGNENSPYTTSTYVYILKMPSSTSQKL